MSLVTEKQSNVTFDKSILDVRGLGTFCDTTFHTGQNIYVIPYNTQDVQEGKDKRTLGINRKNIHISYILKRH